MKTVQVLVIAAILLVAQAAAVTYGVTVSLTKTDCTSAGASAKGTAKLGYCDPACSTTSGGVTSTYNFGGTIDYSGLSAAASAAHIHFGNTSIAYTFTKVTTSTSGTETTAFIKGGTISAALWAAIHDGTAYVNVHTSACSAGEIKGTIPVNWPVAAASGWATPMIAVVVAVIAMLF